MRANRDRKAAVRAAIYARISLDHKGEGLGVSRQREDCQQLADDLGWTVVETYVDNDVSATSGKPRPQYDRMLAAIQAGEVEAIITWHPDRLYRRMVDLTRLLEVVRGAGTQVATVKAGKIDLTTDTGQMMAEILASVASYEGRAKAARWRRSIQQRREAGQAPGWGPRLFGYNRDHTVNEAEAETIRWMVNELSEGVSITALCQALNDRGITTTLGNPWRMVAVKKLLGNPRLAGYSTMNGEIVGRGTWKPILDESTWETARALAETKQRRGNRPRVALLVGIIFCGKCGHKMATAGRARRGGGGPQRIYRCENRLGYNGCGGVSADAEAVEAVVEAYARERLADPKVRAYLARLRETVGDNALEVATLEERIVELEAQLDEPGVPVPTIIRAINRARERRDSLMVTVGSANLTTLPVRGMEWPADLARRANLVRLVVEDVTIQPAAGRSGTFDPERVKIKRRD